MCVIPMASPGQPHPHLRDEGGLTVNDRRVNVGRTHTRYLKAGTGSVLLLLPAHEQRATSWRWVIPALARTHRVLALSLPGHGDTTPAVGDSTLGPDQARFVAAFLGTLDIDPPLDVVGHSACGPIALRLAPADPERIRSVTLVDSAGLGPEVHMISRLPGGDWSRTLPGPSWQARIGARRDRRPIGARPPTRQTSRLHPRSSRGPRSPLGWQWAALKACT